MYDLETIRRLNDAATLKESFPEHDCAEEVTYNPEYEGFLDGYLDSDSARELAADRDALAAIARELIDKLYPVITNQATDLFDRRDWLAQIAVYE